MSNKSIEDMSDKILKGISDKAMKAEIKAELNRLRKSSIKENVGPLPRKRPKEEESSFVDRLLLRLRRIRPGQEKYKAAEAEYVTGLPERFKTKKTNNDMRKSGMFKGGYSTKKK